MNVELVWVTPNAEDVIEKAARICYQSQYKGDGILIRSLIKSGHHSVLEHAVASFKVGGVSRSLTHQLVRHRMCSFSQQSQRYVDESQFEYVIPPSIESIDKELFESQMTTIQSMYDEWVKRGIKKEDARFVLPNACCSEIQITANFREWRHIFEVRCHKSAQWEIRELMSTCLSTLLTIAPNVFYDFELKNLYMNH
jgi:thymidylate synthase (FAD)